MHILDAHTILHPRHPSHTLPRKQQTCPYNREREKESERGKEREREGGRGGGKERGGEIGEREEERAKERWKGGDMVTW